ncbi:hypothetical protein Baya_11811 [Bagarius yarrelli]|uniref:Uncharacterized protein n=1 Tax=Bagarius yarrelli TaxID=175774 RepID=A0A556V171_BAGYA|nr:hypothetical protein Baya_11811 [Bagarius yarrelli]
MNAILSGSRFPIRLHTPLTSSNNLGYSSPLQHRQSKPDGEGQRQPWIRSASANGSPSSTSSTPSSIFLLPPASHQHLFTSSHHLSGSTGAKDGPIIRGRQPDGVSAGALSAPSTDSPFLSHSFYRLEITQHTIHPGRQINSQDEG